MSDLVPRRPSGSGPEPEHARLVQADSREDRLRRWEVRAAQWRACELAEASFGEGVETRLVSLRPHGRLRGLLRLDVPFDSLRSHRAREAEFLAAVGSDALLTRIPLVYIVGPGPG